MIRLSHTDRFIDIASQHDSITAGIIAREHNNADYSVSPEDIRKQEKKILSQIPGVKHKNIIFLDQEHKDRIITVNKEPEKNEYVHATADASITNIPGICLVIRTADCVPVLFFDQQNKAVGAAHSGWKGTMLEISSKTVIAMEKTYGTSPENLLVFILPSIGVESYEVNQDVARFFSNHTVTRNGKIYVNMQKQIEDSLLEHNLKKENIFNSELCNYINHGEYFSHRRGDPERNLNFIVINS